jgi:hypothetical protein
MKQSLNQLAQKINASIPKIEALVINAEVVATTDAIGVVTRRIFNEGKLRDGGSIGNYTSPPYKRRRELKGRQTKFIDLQFTGDLFNSIKVGQFNGHSSIGIVSDKENDVANHLEGRYGVIFTASDEERAVATEVARNYMFAKLKDIIKSWS